MTATTASAGAKPPRSNLRTRVLAAVTLLPLVLSAFIWGPAWFVVLFLLLCLTFCVGELALMLIPAFERKLAPGEVPVGLTVPGAKPTRHSLTYTGISVTLGWAALLASTSGTAEVPIGAMALCALAALLIGSFSAKTIELAASHAFGILISLCYGALPWLVVWQLYNMAPHARFVLLVMTITWCGDTGGYFGGRFYGGRLFGSRKLAPVISPKKTWEGAAAGLILSVVGAVALNLLFLNSLGSPLFIAGTAVCGGVAAQLGDLVESTFKRFSEVKDSGAIIPGHGGFLDRVDGILFAAPVVWAILYYFR